MPNSQANHYIEIAQETLERAWESQQEVIEDIANAMADTVRAGHSLYVFGCSHAGILAEEVFYRSGGLALMNPIFFPGFMLNTRPVTMTSSLERVAGIGKVLLDENRVGKGDFLLIHSVSGRNTVPVEMAMEARKRGVTVACITNLAYSKQVNSRHESGLRLYEVCDLVVDNCGVRGDAAVQIPGVPEPIGPTSTCVGTALLNAMVIRTVELLSEDGTIPPVLLSANLDGGGEHNARIFRQYRENITYM